MFFIAHRERELTMHPSFFDSAATEKIKEQLHSDLEGTIEGTLMIIQIIEIDEISEPMLVPGTGMAKYNVSYRALVWRPFRGEVVDGMVTNVVNNGFFVDVGGMNVFVSKAMIPNQLKYTVEGSTPSFTDNSEQMIEKGSQVRLRIKGIRGEIGAMFAIGSIREDYLG
ncbi:hypothetical protein M409DRAFT_62603 [Zasmidium cellare ATCC 36951]|uniref:DNA-directed RNA polymerase subunit n=1 Tax=Zasmidium cellare ATCC 36951 TaxID=1080233 RepID=A0A6A6D3I1_ZASCE|nr:uncharacterized protein M409DRAFT_62603 [Zasmidium cellare ATCC 36951]KAF2172960.1 hypothetical protein M409DRAFT_62603 [Zasmidium cellare ATCC 36951]